MPRIKSAKKKLRKDKKRTKLNLLTKSIYKDFVKKIKKGSGKVKDFDQKISKVYSKIDKAAKKNVIHKKRAARLKARIAKLKR